MKFIIASLGLCLCVLGLFLGQRGWGSPQLERGAPQLGSAIILFSSGSILLAIAAAIGRMDALVRQVQLLTARQKAFMTELAAFDATPQSPANDQTAGIKSQAVVGQDLSSQDSASQDSRIQDSPIQDTPKPDLLNNIAPVEKVLAPLASPKAEAPKRKLWSFKSSALKSAPSKPKQWERHEPIVPPLFLQTENAMDHQPARAALITAPAEPQELTQASSQDLPQILLQVMPRMASVVTGPWSQPEQKPHDEQASKSVQSVKDEELTDQAEPTRTIIRRYDSQGIAYQLFSDGSIEAQTEKGQFKFAGLTELRGFIERRSALAS